MTPAGDPSLSLLSGQSLVPLVLVLALLFALVWALRRGSLPLGRFNRLDVKIEGTVSLGERRSLVIVTVEGKRLLLGLTPAAVSLVTELGVSGGFEGALARRTAADRESGVSS